MTSAHLTLPQEAMLLRIFMGEKESKDGQPLYDFIVKEARRHHMAGATVLRGPLGYGHSSRIHRADFLDVSEDLPIVIEIIDTLDKINSFIPALDVMRSGLVTLEKVQVLRYGSAQQS